MIETETVTLAVPVNERDHMMGPANARVTVVNYGDYECPGCHERHRATEKMARELRDTVRLVHRHFPLVKSHPRALRAAEAAEAAGAQKNFWGMHDLLFENQSALEDEDLVAYAGELGLDETRLIREVTSTAYAQRIREDFKSGVRGGGERNADVVYQRQALRRCA